MPITSTGRLGSQRKRIRSDSPVRSEPSRTRRWSSSARWAPLRQGRQRRLQGIEFRHRLLQPLLALPRINVAAGRCLQQLQRCDIPPPADQTRPRTDCPSSATGAAGAVAAAPAPECVWPQPWSRPSTPCGACVIPSPTPGIRGLPPRSRLCRATGPGLSRRPRQSTLGALGDGALEGRRCG